MITSMKITGLSDLGRNLKALEEKVQGQVLRRAVEAGAQPVLESAKSNAPVDTGQLRDSLEITTSLKEGTAVASVGTGEKDYQGETFYASFVEYGHTTKQGKHVPPKPFLRPAFDSNKERSMGIIVDELKRGIEQAAKGVS